MKTPHPITTTMGFFAQWQSLPTRQSWDSVFNPSFPVSFVRIHILVLNKSHVRSRIFSIARSESKKLTRGWWGLWARWGRYRDMRTHGRIRGQIGLAGLSGRPASAFVILLLAFVNGWCFVKKQNQRLDWIGRIRFCQTRLNFCPFSFFTISWLVFPS